MSMMYDEEAAAQMFGNLGKQKAKEISNNYKLGKDEIKARLKIASQSSKDTRFGIEQERDAARERVEQARQEMERIGIPDMEIRRFVAESNAEIARQELGLKREIFLAESGLARDQLAKDIREMEEIGIPRVEIERYSAEKAAELGQLEYTLKRDAFVEESRRAGIDFEEARRQFDTTHAEEARQFNVKASGYMQEARPLSGWEQERYGTLQNIAAQNPEQLSSSNRAELAQFEAIRSGQVDGTQQRTLEGTELDRQFQLDVARFGADEAERRRRYGLDVSKFGAELASTPDTYFAGRRFQGVDVPRLMGGAGAPTAEPGGGPTPGVATMGAYLAGQDPYGGGIGAGAERGGGGMATPYGGPQAGAAQPAAPGTLGMPGTPEDDRFKQIQGIAKLSPPSPYDGLDSQDAATLGLMEQIYRKGGNQIARGEYERLGASGRLGYLKSAGRILGYDPAELESQYKAYEPAQGSSRLA